MKLSKPITESKEFKDMLDNLRDTARDPKFMSELKTTDKDVANAMDIFLAVMLNYHLNNGLKNSTDQEKMNQSANLGKQLRYFVKFYVDFDPVKYAQDMENLIKK